MFFNKNPLAQLAVGFEITLDFGVTYVKSFTQLIYFKGYFLN